MMDLAVRNSKPPAAPAPALSEAQVAVAVEGNAYLLDDGRLVRQAASCVLTPEPGDRVLAVTARGGDGFIVHVLERANDESAELSVPGVPQLLIRQRQVRVQAQDSVAVHALGDVEVTAATGVLALNARNLFATVHDALVQNVRHFVGKADQYLLDVRQLLKLHGQQALITADSDVKVDGERISMG